MKQLCIRLLRLTIGLLLYAVGVVLTLNARIGYAPWDVFHAGFAKTTGLSIGTASIVTGLIIVIIAIALGERLGFGTIANMVLVGAFVDIILGFGIIPISGNPVLGVIMLITGLCVIAIATYFYMSSDFGTGPRDSLMVALTRKTKLPIGACRSGVELLAVVVGWVLGGMVGIGTIISVLTIGFYIQTTFKIFKYNPENAR